MMSAYNSQYTPVMDDAAAGNHGASPNQARKENL
jgi:hypothetical protein